MQPILGLNYNLLSSQKIWITRQLDRNHLIIIHLNHNRTPVSSYFYIPIKQFVYLKISNDLASLVPGRMIRDHTEFLKECYRHGDVSDTGCIIRGHNTASVDSKHSTLQVKCQKKYYKYQFTKRWANALEILLDFSSSSADENVFVHLPITIYCL